MGWISTLAASVGALLGTVPGLEPYLAGLLPSRSPWRVSANSTCDHYCNAHRRRQMCAACRDLFYVCLSVEFFLFRSGPVGWSAISLSLVWFTCRASIATPMMLTRQSGHTLKTRILTRTFCAASRHTSYFATQRSGLRMHTHVARFTRNVY